ncbi:MAG TPA: AsnC family transcriptional regulator, partial [Alcaligenes faecalis]|nr:AsnC family transcriptional regulator [Alcaligenes faecalis]
SFSLQEFKGLNALPIPAMAGPAA